MANPGLDGRNADADDVLLPRRQREIAELVERLARYRPTKIAVEAPYRDADVGARYKRFLAGQYALGRDETEQIGFRLARMLKHPAVYPVDYPMFMSGLRYDEVELKPRPQRPPGEPPAPAPAPPALSEDDLRLRRSTVTEFLYYLNDPEKAAKEHGRDYLRQLLPTGDPAIYESADRVANWYKRNLRMFANLNRITEFPNDRILLIVGSGTSRSCGTSPSTRPSSPWWRRATFSNKSTPAKPNALGIDRTCYARRSQASGHRVTTLWPLLFVCRFPPAATAAQEGLRLVVCVWSLRFLHD
jgi:hypothetical protein